MSKNTRVMRGWMAAALVLAGCGPAPAQNDASGGPFTDVPKTHWAYDAVESLRQRGIMRGYPPAPAPAAQAAPRNAVRKTPRTGTTGTAASRNGRRRAPRGKRR